MHVFICSIKPKPRLISFVVVISDRVLMCSWIPHKYPERCRIEKVVQGASLDKGSFSTLTKGIAQMLTPVYQGKTINSWLETVGSVFSIGEEGVGGQR